MESSSTRGPFHRFLLLAEGSVAYEGYSRFLGQKDYTVPSIRIEDGVLIYLTNTFNWVPSINPQNRENGRTFGLNLYGATIINQAGGSMLNQITTAWERLFALGPEVINLYRYQEVTVGPNGEEESISKQFSLSRNELCHYLNILSEFASKAATGEYFILHLGI